MIYILFIICNIGDVFGGIGLQFQVKDMLFLIVDKDNDQYNDGSCVWVLRGGWWYNRCLMFNLNGENCEDGESCMIW